MNILIVKLAALGDVLRTTCLLEPLRRRYPDAKITWVTAASAAPLLANNPWLARVLSLEEARLEKSFDLVLSLEEDASAARLAQDACRGELVGIYPDGGKLRYTASSAAYYDMSLLNADAAGGLSAADRLKAANKLSYARLWLQILKLPAPSSPMRPWLTLTEEELAFKHPAGAGFIAINPGAGARWPAKQVSEEKAARILATLAVLGRPLILFGGKDEAQRNRAIAAKVPGVVDPGTDLDLRSFAALVNLCDAVVTTDSLAFHVAAALGKGVAVLVGPTSAAELDGGPRCVKLVPEEGCSCFYRPRCRLETSCLDAIPEPAVVEAVKRCLT